MKVNLYEAGGRLEGGYTIPGMILTGPLLLSGKVSSPSEAIHKQYIDTAVTNLDAASFVSGSIATARLPGFTGDVTSNNSSNVVNLNASGVIAGDYTKVTVDVKGRVITGLSLTESDLPSMSWNKINPATKPTTLAGYGITDGVSTGNGVLTGALTLIGNPTDANHAATKAYADANVAGSSKIVSGDIISHVANSTPAGFLRCNGGEVSKTTYAALYAVIGDAFSSGNTLDGAGQPWRQQYAFNETQLTAITGWAALGGSSGALITAMANGQAIVTKSRIYIIGGYTTGYISTVWTATINSDGSLGTWNTGTALPNTVGYAQVLVTKNRVYLLGGVVGGAYVTSCYTAPINADGTLGSWIGAPNLATPSGGGRAFITKNRAYMLGGFGSTGATTTIQTAVIAADGTISSWSTVTPGLPTAVENFFLFVTKNRVYIGGNNNGSTAAMYTAPIDADGLLGSWTAAGNLPAAIGRGQIVTTRNRVYLIGGYTSGGPSSAVYSAPINPDGTIGTWATNTSLPNTLYDSHVVVVRDKIYVLGGYQSGNTVTTVYGATFSGGMNDYSSYYDGSITTLDPNNFKLPNYTTYEKTSMYFFIKS